MPLELSPGLGWKWIKQLLTQLARVRSNRKEGIRKATQVVAGVDPFWLAERYVEPNVQETNPADDKEESPSPTARLNRLHTWLSLFLQKPYPRKDGRHVLFLLADAGMGKTSALVMLYLSQIASFWPKSIKFELIKASKDIFNEIENIKNSETTVLLLDALDEDRSALGDMERRICNILRSTRKFRQIIVTCRTQFFPHKPKDDHRSAHIGEGKFEIGGFVCKLLYLSPFDDQKVYEYLEKIYVPGEPNFDRARTMVESVENLRIRPLILCYIEDLLEDSQLEQTNTLGLYESLIRMWIEREVRKLGELGIVIQPQDLVRVCQELAHSMTVSGADEISTEEIEDRVSKEALKHIEPIDLGGRSLLNRTSNGGYRFAHLTIKEYLVFRLADSSDSTLPPPPPSDMINTFLAMAQNKKDTNLHTLETLRNNLKNIDLEGANLEGINFEGANLYGANLKGSNLKGANLARANLTRSKLDNSNLSDANLCRANLTDASLFRTVLERTQLEDANFYRAKLYDTIFRNAEISRVNFAQSEIQRADFRQATLQGAIFHGATFTSTIFSQADLRKADFKQVNLKNTNLHRAICKETDFRETNLNKANLSGTDFHGATLDGALLAEAEGLTQHQLETSAGSTTTQLPKALTIPAHWITDPREH